MFRDDDSYTHGSASEDDGRAMDELQLASERAIDDILGGRGVAPICEMCDDDTFGQHPASDDVDRDDLGLEPAGVAEPEEDAILEIESHVADALEGVFR